MSADIKCAMLESDKRKRRAALREFNERPDCRVFLLSLRHGAAGLTLVRLRLRLRPRLRPKPGLLVAMPCLLLDRN